MNIKNLKIRAIVVPLTITLLTGGICGEVILNSKSAQNKTAITSEISYEQQELYVFEKQVIETVNDRIDIARFNDGSSYLEYKNHKEMFTRRIVSESKEVEGWNLIGLYDQNLNDSMIYVYKKTEYGKPIFVENKFGGFYEAPAGYLLDSVTKLAYKNSYLFANIGTLHLSGNDAKKYEFLGLCDEKLYNEYKISVKGEIATIELGNAKTKK